MENCAERAAARLCGQATAEYYKKLMSFAMNPMMHAAGCSESIPNHRDQPHAQPDTGHAGSTWTTGGSRSSGHDRSAGKAPSAGRTRSAESSESTGSCPGCGPRHFDLIVLCTSGLAMNKQNEHNPTWVLFDHLGMQSQRPALRTRTNRTAQKE